MPFSGLSTNRLFTPNLVGEDISGIMRTLAPIEAPVLDWLGDAGVFAQSTKHEYVQDFLRPHYIINSGAVASATAVTAFQVNGLGEAITVGTLLENESAAPAVVPASLTSPAICGTSRSGASCWKRLCRPMPVTARRCWSSTR